MRNEFLTLLQVLHRNQDVIATWFDPQTEPATLHVVLDRNGTHSIQELPATLRDVPLMLHVSDPIKPLITYDVDSRPANDHQTCQNEPIQLGTQIQPSLANWLGTAGAPVRWLDANKKPHWGILSNWHVMASGHQKVGRPQHQPTTGRPAIAKLRKWSEPKPDKNNLIDAAIADASIDGLHTIGPDILGLGPIGPSPINARIGLTVLKSGRTTTVTAGTCIGVGAAVRVGYGDFSANFVDQDIYQPNNGPFSAAGDSGSLIVDADDYRPCSLLFAGSAQITVGNPIRHVADAFNLVFPFN